MPDIVQESTGRPSKTADGHHRSKDARDNEVKKKPTLLALVFVKDDTNHSVHVQEKPIEEAINTFVESAKVCISILENVAEIHPFIAAPVLAFKLVVSLDLKRRENNAKVLAVKAQMQSMMSVLFQLRNVKDPDDIGPDGKPLRGRLQTLMEEIEESIKNCGSACDVYMKKSFLRKYIKAHQYEARLAAYGTRFAEIQSELSTAVAVHTTLGVDSANHKLDDQRITLDLMKEQLQEIFIRLDTPREREVRKIIEENRGAKACIQNTLILNELVDKTGEDLITESSSRNQEDRDISSIQKSLFKELAEDIDIAFQQNFALFSGKLDLQRKEIEEAMNILKRQGDQILAFFSGGHERIVDPQLRKIWKEMGWKSTVKARHFVLALRDFFTGEIEEPGEMLAKLPDVSTEAQLLSPPLTGSPNDATEYTFHSANDEWAKSYINVAYLQSILEAIDDDGSAFINIKEVNTFALSRPEGWTLLQWIAYWAAGWQSSISLYKTKLYRTLRKMHKLLQKARPDNRRIIDAYLDNLPFFKLESMLRATRTTVESGIVIAPELAKLTEEFTQTEEKKLRENLESISYIIDSTATVSLLTGPGRIERYIYPLLHLILERHVKILHLARTHVLHLEEMYTWSNSLSYIFSAFENRLQDVTAIFKQMHINAERQFENFAFGMFKSLYGGFKWNISQVTLRSVWDDLPDDPGQDDDIDVIPTDIPTTLLKHGPQEPFSLPSPEPFEVIIQPDDGPGIVKGSWAGYTTWDDGDPHEGLFRIKFNETGEKGTITGNADGYIGSLEMNALLIPPNEESEGYTIDFVMVYQDGYWIRCLGSLDTAAGTIIGRWYSQHLVTQPKPDPGSETVDYRFGSFEFSRTPADLARFRYSRKEFEENAARARWAFACAAIRYTVQRRLLTPSYVVKRFKDGRRFKELVIKRFISNNGYTLRTEFTSEEKLELNALENVICPYVDQFYYSIARFVHYRITYHFGITCDGCGRKIQQSRLLCIVCRDNTNNSVDFCIECYATELPDNDTHTLSHSLLRGDRYIHDCNRAWAIPVARKTSERIKAAFRSQAAIGKIKENHEDAANPHEKDESAGSPFKCLYCEKTVSLPCWVCLECPGDTFVCDDCDLQRQFPGLPEKLVTAPPSVVHMMLRITDDIPVEIPNDEQFTRVERKLTGVTHSVDEKLDGLQELIRSQTRELEAKFINHIGAITGNVVADESPELKVGEQTTDSQGGPTQSVNHRLSALEMKVDEKFASLQEQFSSLDARFSSLETLLREFLSSQR